MHPEKPSVVAGDSDRCRSPAGHEVARGACVDQGPNEDRLVDREPDRHERGSEVHAFIAGPRGIGMACENDSAGTVILGSKDAREIPAGQWKRDVHVRAPRVAILNNGTKKGGSAELLAALHQAAGLEDAWQLHRSLPPGPGP